MTSIVIAGRPNSEQTSRCILLGENLKMNFPDINIIIILKHPEEWDSYAEELSNLFGFKENSKHPHPHPFVYKSNGEFIGNEQNFRTYLIEKYKYEMDFETAIVEKLTQENIKIVQMEYISRTEGANLIEKIDNVLKEIDFDPDISPLDIDFDISYEKGMKIFYKISQKFSPKLEELNDPVRKSIFSNLKKKNIFQQEIIEEKKETIDNDLDNNDILGELKLKEEISVSPKKNVDEKKNNKKGEKKEEEKIEKKEEIKETKKEDNKKDNKKDKKSDLKKIDSPKKDLKDKRDPSDKDKFTKKSTKSINDKSIRKDLDKSHNKGKSVNNSNFYEDDVVEDFEEIPQPKYLTIEYDTYNEIQPEKYLIEDFNKYIVEKNIGFNYQLFVNPFPNLYGEFLIYFNDIDKDTEGQIVDYGRIPSLRKLTYTDEILLKNVKFVDPVLTSRLKYNVVDFNYFLSDYDLYYLIKVIKEISGIGFLQILPYGEWNHKKFGSSNIRISKLPLKDLKGDQIPLNLIISQKIKELKREKIKDASVKNGIDYKTENVKIEVLIENEMLSDYFKIKEYFTIQEYDFPHLILCFNKDNFNFSSIKAEISRMLTKLNITNTDKGVNFIITNEFIFMCPLVNPYAHVDGHPIYAEPEFYAGIFNLPLIETEWPQTVDKKYIEYDFFNILKNSASENLTVHNE